MSRLYLAVVSAIVTGISLLSPVAASGFPRAGAQAPTRPMSAEAQATGVVTGRITATAGQIPLAGVAVTLRTPPGQEVDTVLSGPDGRFRFTGLGGGTYVLAVSTDGFDPFERELAVARGQTTDVACELKLTAVRETVDVVRPGEPEVGFGVTASIGARATLDGSRLSSSPLMDGDVTAGLRMMAGVVQRGAALSIRGGRSNQSRMEIDGSDVSDPATGESWYRLPGDAVAIVDVLASPPATEYGRFASGLTAFQSKRGRTRVDFAVNNLEPGLITKRGQPLAVVGLESVSPRFTIGGPVVKDRLFVAESAQLRYMSSEIQSRPQDERRRNLNFGNFLRMDGVVSPRHTLAGTVGMYWKRLSAANIDTFTPPDSAAKIHYWALNGSVRDTLQLSGNALLETRVYWGRMDVSTASDGTGDYVLAPDEVKGAFFNTQERWSRSWQGSTSVSWSTDGPLGSHLLKAGVDLQRTGLRASSSSRPVRIVRADGSTVGVITFGNGRPGNVHTLDAAGFVQDRWQPHGRIALEGGVRVDRNGAVGGVGLAPRIGAVFALRADQSTTIRTSAGVFRERTPAATAAFADLEPRTETFAGMSPVTYVPRLLQTGDAPRSVTWSLGLSHRLSRGLTAGVQVLRRTGAHEFVVNQTGTGAARTLTLGTGGRSRYRDAEVTVRYAPAPGFETTASYTRASSWSDLNAFSLLYGDLRGAILRPNVNTRSDYDVPHRVLARTAAPLGRLWMTELAVDWRSGFPWSAVDETLQYAGTPNQGRRFPSVGIVEFALERRVKLWKLNGWVGVDVYNLLNAFAPIDVQRNITSPRFGYYFNADRRSIRVGFRMH